MKKICSIFMALIMSFSFAGCDSSENNTLLQTEPSEAFEFEKVETCGNTIAYTDTVYDSEDTVFESEEVLIEDFPVILQTPELPTGCEITALTMALRFYGYDVDKTVMAAEFLPTASDDLYYGEDGLLYGSDLREYFVGDPFSYYGYICGAKAIETAANAYLEEEGSTLKGVDITGTSPQELYQFVYERTPVVVWVTIEMADRYTTEGWYTLDGSYVEWSTNDHCAVLMGYSEDSVFIADPLSGLVEYDRDRFESVFESRGCQCVILTQ